MRINQITEKWSQKYKKSIDCSNPKGFSQKAHCAGRKKKKSESICESYEIEFVCVNPNFCDATEQKNQDKLFQALRAVPGIIVYKQDFDAHNSMAAIIKDEADTDAPKLIKKLAQQHKVAIDLENDVSQGMMDDIVSGRLEGLTDYYDTDRKKKTNEAPQGFASMNLDAQKVQQSIDYFYTDHAPKNIGGRKEEGSFKGFKIVSFTKAPDTLMFLVDNNDQAVFYVAYSKLKDGVAIGNVRSNGTVKATEVYAMLVDKFGKLYSDLKQTPQGAKIWTSLAKFYPNIVIKDTGDRFLATKKANESIPSPDKMGKPTLPSLQNTIKDLNDLIKDLDKGKPQPKEIILDPEDYREKRKEFKKQGKPYMITKAAEGKRIPRKKGQPAGSKKHSDLYTDENPKGTIHGLKFATVADAKASVSKIRNSGKSHAHKIQAAVAMEQRAKAAGKTTAAGVYRTYINAMKKKTKKKNESIYENKEIRTQKRKDGFTISLYVDNKHVGQYTHTRDDDIVRNFAEIFPEYRNKGYGTMLLLAAIKTADDMGMDFEEDTQSLTPAMSRLYDELSDSGLIYGGGGAWTVSPSGENELEDFLNESSKVDEGVNDPHIFKAVFMAGGPGSGKSFVAQNILGGTGLRAVNSDEVYEFLLKRQGLSLDPDTIASPQGQEIRGTAKDLTAKRQQNYIDGRIGLLIDGTGKNVSVIQDLAQKLKSIGYSVSMIFVNTSLQVAQQRNRQRDRVLPAKLVADSWNEVQQNLMKYQQIFGADRFHIVDNSGGLEDLDRQKNFDKVYNEVQRFLNTPPKHKKALAWIQNQKAQNNAKPTTNSGKSDGGVTSTN